MHQLMVTFSDSFIYNAYNIKKDNNKAQMIKKIHIERIRSFSVVHVITNLVEWLAMRKQKKNKCSTIEPITVLIIITLVFINIEN